MQPDEHLWQTYQADPTSEKRNALVEFHLPLARKIAYKWANSSRRFDSGDFMGWAALGLINAVEKFDPDKGNKFSTYAWHAIQRNIIRGLENETQKPSWNQNKTEFFESVAGEDALELHPGHPDDHVQAVEDRDEIEWLLWPLHERERDFLTGCADGLSMRQIGKEYGITGSRVQQLIAKAKEKIRERRISSSV